MRKCIEPATCRSCSALVLWVEWPSSGKKMPIDVSKYDDGSVVVNMVGGEYGKLTVEKYDAARHEGRNRYKSHFATCPNASAHRKAD